MSDVGIVAGAAVDLTPIENRLDAAEKKIEFIEKNLGSYDGASVKFLWESKLDAIQPKSKIRKALSEGWLIKDMQYIEFTPTSGQFEMGYGILFVLQRSSEAKVSQELVWCSKLDFKNAERPGLVPYKTLGVSYLDNKKYKYGFLFVFQK